MSTKKHLCIIGDDFGMHPAVNEGIAKAFSEGILTDSNLMPPTPNFLDAVALTKTLGIPVGLHATFTCEWDIYSWGPLTEARSFVTSDGRLKENVEEAWRNATEEETLKELHEQYRVIEAEGIPITHVGQHMGFDQGRKFETAMNMLVKEKNLPYKGAPDAHIPFALTYNWSSSFIISGPMTVEEAKARLKSILGSLATGYHLWVTHPAIDHASMDDLCSVDCPARNWARPYRSIDLDLLLDEEVADLLKEDSIELTSLSDCPICTETEQDIVA
jgi:predicted glycoside hydrolase/deacetylase ChbG (UPF0249 family)